MKLSQLLFPCIIYLHTGSKDVIKYKEWEISFIKI